jgi:hypothetical protein
MADVVPPSTAVGFVTKMSDKHKSTSPSAIQAINHGERQTILKRNYR